MDFSSQEVKSWALRALPTAIGLGVALFLLGIGRVHAAPAPTGRTIYGEDNRQDLYEVSDALQLRWATSTVALFQDMKVTTDSTTGAVTLSLASYQKRNKLCSDQKFIDQKSGAFCTGALIAPNRVLTAAHCVMSQSTCDSTKLVFDFSLRAPGATPEQFNASQVYQCKKIVKSAFDAKGADFAIIELDRAVTDRSPLQLNLDQALKVGTPLVLIGHPSGLPTKIAGDAKVRSIDTKKGFFVANTDSFHGNSGSPVLNAKTGEIEGVLVRGADDFVYRETDGCYINNVLPQNEGGGEDVTLSATIAPSLAP